MPCADGHDNLRFPHTEQYDKDFLEAALCAVMSTNPSLDSIYWSETGIDKRDLIAWWEAHQEADKKRRQKELKDAALAVLRRKALSKLSPSERAVLGFDEED